ncbi:MAG: hypothetical protein M1840_006814 [Geoglossum simile]|nr:MAG: hypothetical protein M1840_006814 [Geoglossum simile]
MGGNHSRHGDIFTHGPDLLKNILEEVANRLQNSGEPETDEIIMDGVRCMVARSLSVDSAVELTTPLPDPFARDLSAASHPEHLAFEQCRKCSDIFTVRLQDGGVVSIICGVPEAGNCYKAMSYVWGDTSLLDVPCRRCGHISVIPMANAQRFRNLMELGGSRNHIWLDAISIDQTDPNDINACVAVMGSIYRNADRVSVLLPAGDSIAFEFLCTIECHAMVILCHHQNFLDNSEITIPFPTGESLSQITQHLMENTKRLRTHTSLMAYWNRAWTFQEWALAKDLEVAVEGGQAQTCSRLKSVALGAGMLVSKFKLLYGQYAKINVGFDRTAIVEAWENIKCLFPEEDLFRTYEEVDSEEVSFQTNFPHFGVNKQLGLHDAPGMSLESRTDQTARLRARLLLLLSNFSMSPRAAKYDADLVACWASTCDISYGYDRNDSFPASLHKAATALRAQGITLYQFLPETRGGKHPPFDFFCDYARGHIQLSTGGRVMYPGAPLFTGRADTSMHLISSVNKVELPTQWVEFESSSLRPVCGAIFEKLIGFKNAELILAKFNNISYGEVLGPSGLMFFSLEGLIKVALETLDVNQLAFCRLCVVSIPFLKAGQSEGTFHILTWAIVPRDIKRGALRVCRESVNGTLVLICKQDGAKHIVAYLTLTDKLCGTFLLQTDSNGYVDLTFKTPELSGMTISVHPQKGVKYLRGRVPLEDEIAATVLPA